MAIKIKGKYTNPAANFVEKQGLYDTKPTTIIVQKNGTVQIKKGDVIQDTKDLFLGYVGEDRVRVINFDTRNLHWGKQIGEKDSEAGKEPYNYYSRRVIFYNPKEPIKKFVRNSDGTILVQSDENSNHGKFKVQVVDENGNNVIESGLPNPFVISADQNYIYIPNEVTDKIRYTPNEEDIEISYEIVYALIEKQDEEDSSVEGNIADNTCGENCSCEIDDCDCINNEVFVSEVFTGYTKKASKSLFDRHTGGYYQYDCGKTETPGLSEKHYLHKPLLVCNVDKGELKRPKGKPHILLLGCQGDAYITPLDIKLPIQKGIWNIKKEETKMEIIFSKRNESYLIQPDIKEISTNTTNNLHAICWVPKEVTKSKTEENENWQIGLHLWTEKEPLFEVYTTIIEGEVKYTFLEDKAQDQDILAPLYQVQDETLVIAGEDWEVEGLDIWAKEDNNDDGITADLGRHQV